MMYIRSPIPVDKVQLYIVTYPSILQLKTPVTPSDPLNALFIEAVSIGNRRWLFAAYWIILNLRVLLNDLEV